MNQDYANAIEQNARRHLCVSFGELADKKQLLAMEQAGEKVHLKVAPRAVDSLVNSLKLEETAVSYMFKNQPAVAMAFLTQVASRKEIGVPAAHLASALTNAAATRKANMQAPAHA